MAKVNRNAFVSLTFWFVYHQIIATIISFGTGVNWWILQPFVVVLSLLMMSLTAGSQTKDR
jgi:hypothetical protein